MGDSLVLTMHLCFATVHEHSFASTGHLYGCSGEQSGSLMCLQVKLLEASNQGHWL